MKTNNTLNMIEWVYTIDPNVECPIMLLNGEVGMDISGSQFAKELYTLDAMGRTDIKIMINSIGGSVIEGMSIYDAIMATDANVITYNVGVALSIAAVIFLAGDYRIMRDYARLMYHNPYNEDGSEDSGLEEIRESLITMVAAKTGASEEMIGTLLAKETWINADEAKSIGFTDDIKETQLITKEKIDKKEDILNTWKMANMFMNKFMDEETNIKTEKMRKVIKVKNADMSEADKEAWKKGMDKDLAEADPKNDADDIVNSAEDVEELEEEKEELEEEIEEAKEEMDDDDTQDSAEEIKDLKNQLATCMNELEAMKNLMAKAEEEAMDAKISNMLNGFIQAGKIKGDKESISDWKASAKNNFEFTERLINNLPVTKNAVKFDVNNTNDIIASGKDYVSLRMAELRSKQVK